MKNEYDDKGQLISETIPGDVKLTYEYDDRGNLISETSSSGDKYTYEYDELGRMISETSSSGENTFMNTTSAGIRFQKHAQTAKIDLLTHEKRIRQTRQNYFKNLSRRR